MGQKTPLYAEHLAAAAKMVDFAGWDMPLHYGSQVDEHHRVRSAAGMFDVSHMCIVDLRGPGAEPLLARLLANNVQHLTIPGRALYSCMLNDNGGVIDDLIVYFLAAGDYRMVVNAATRGKDLAWLEHHAESYEVEVSERPDLAMVAVQGPEARERLLPLLSTELATAARELKPFYAAWSDDRFVARTGYTGEDGFEVMLPGDQAPALWRELAAAGVAPTGLGARDTLRLEAGMNLYGHDMDESTTPLESGLAWTVAWDPEDRAFIGRERLQRQRREGVPRKLVGLLLEGRGVMRNHQPVRALDGAGNRVGHGVGEVTSGGFSPTLNRSIALARVPAALAETAGRCEVELRGTWQPARIVKPPFVRTGKALIEI